MSRCPDVTPCRELELSEVSEIVFINFRHNTLIMMSTPENAKMNKYCFRALHFFVQTTLTHLTSILVFTLFTSFTMPTYMYHQVAILVYLIYLIYQTNYYDSPDRYFSPDSYSCLIVYPVY